MDWEAKTKDKPPHRANATDRRSPETDCINALVMGTLMVSGERRGSGWSSPGRARNRTTGAAKSTFAGVVSRVVRLGISRYSPNVRLASLYMCAIISDSDPCGRCQPWDRKRA